MERQVAGFRYRRGPTVKENEILRVAFNSFDLASAGLRLKQLRRLADDRSTALTEYDLQVRQALCEYIRKCHVISPSSPR